MEPVIEVCIVPKEMAERIAREILEKHLAVSVDIVPGIWGLYKWQGNLHSNNDDVTMLMTTDYELVEELCGLLLDIHPWKMPVIVTLTIEELPSPYRDMIQQQLGIESW
jgi:periplasmic divalent cation tolerance protein